MRIKKYFERLNIAELLSLNSHSDNINDDDNDFLLTLFTISCLDTLANGKKTRGNIIHSLYILNMCIDIYGYIKIPFLQDIIKR